MSISIAHPERYDECSWGTRTGLVPEEDDSPKEWELLGQSDDFGFLWGHLKPEYRGGQPLLDMVASIADSLRALADHRLEF